MRLSHSRNHYGLPYATSVPDGNHPRPQERSPPKALADDSVRLSSRVARVIHLPTRYCAAVNQFCGSTSTNPACGKNKQGERRVILRHRPVAGGYDQFLYAGKFRRHFDLVRARTQIERHLKLRDGRGVRVDPVARIA